MKEERIPRLQSGHVWLVSDTIQRNIYAHKKGTNEGYNKSQAKASTKLVRLTRRDGKPCGTRVSVNEEYRTVDGRETAANTRKVTERVNTRHYSDVSLWGENQRSCEVFVIKKIKIKKVLRGGSPLHAAISRHTVGCVRLRRFTSPCCNKQDRQKCGFIYSFGPR